MTNRPMNMLSRRHFLKTSLLSTAGLSLPAWSWAQVPGANGDIRVAVIGFGGRGGSHISAFSEMEGVRLVALCDCDTKILERGAKRLQDKGITVETFTDVRKLLQSKDIDA